MPLQVRDANAGDAAGCAAIYAGYVLDSIVSFELEPPSVAEVAARMAAAAERHCWLVALDVESGALLGYAYATSYSSRPAYRWTCEPSVYLAPRATGRGVGRVLYETLLHRLTDLGFRQAVAGISLPNPASMGLHEALGFEVIGVLRAVGWKHGAWHDVLRLQRPLAGGSDPPRETGSAPQHSA